MLSGQTFLGTGTASALSHAQFQYINTQAKAFLAANEPIISVDTKKKELVGNFKNNGREWRRQGAPELVNIHDFIDPKLKRAVPYGIPGQHHSSEPDFASGEELSCLSADSERVRNRAELHTCHCHACGQHVLSDQDRPQLYGEGPHLCDLSLAREYTVCRRAGPACSCRPGRVNNSRRRSSARSLPSSGEQANTHRRPPPAEPGGAASRSSPAAGPP